VKGDPHEQTAAMAPAGRATASARFQKTGAPGPHGERFFYGCVTWLETEIMAQMPSERRLIFFGGLQRNLVVVSKWASDDLAVGQRRDVPSKEFNCSGSKERS